MTTIPPKMPPLSGDVKIKRPKTGIKNNTVLSGKVLPKPNFNPETPNFPATAGLVKPQKTPKKKMGVIAALVASVALATTALVKKAKAKKAQEAIEKNLNQ